MELITGIFLLTAGVSIALGLGWYAWRHRRQVGTPAFAAMIGLGVFWLVADVFELTAGTLEAKLLWANLRFFPFAFLPVAWLVLVLDFLGRRSWTRGRFLVLLCLIPVTTQVMAWTDSYHHLLRSSVWLVQQGTYQVLGRSAGPWLWIHSVYNYVLIATAVGLLMKAALTCPRSHRRQAIALLLAPCLVGVLDLLRVTRPEVVLVRSIAPIVLGIAGMMVAWALFRFQVFCLGPIARHTLVEHLPDGVLVLDHADRVIDLNRSAQEVIGRPATEIIARPLSESWSAWRQIAAPYTAGSSRSLVRLGQNGGRRHFEVEWSPLRRKQDTVGRVVVLRDVTERLLMEDNLRRQALTDTLTGLPNRAFFMSRLDDAIHRARRDELGGFAVLILDLDRFKLINDSIGHLAGDILLQDTAARLSRSVREADTVARMGGDEFMVLLQEITGTEDLIPILERIREQVRRPVTFRSHEISTTCSIGVVIWDRSYKEPEDLLRAADTAMYQAKENGRNRYRIFDEDMHRAALLALEEETQLRLAIDRRSFSLAYQPIVDLNTGRVISLEALLRWRHTQRGTVYPDDFIPVAENTGLIVELGMMAAEQLARHMRDWCSLLAPSGEFSVSLNVSPRQLAEPDFVPALLDILDRYDVPTARITLEITEAALISDIEQARSTMHELRESGLRLCLDDFGTGFSSLQHLIVSPVQELKIDRSFVARIAREKRDFEVVRSLVQLAHTLGIKVIAEGIESEEQLLLLRQIGCDRGQGYYLSRPLDPDDLPQNLRALSWTIPPLIQGAPRLQ